MQQVKVQAKELVGKVIVGIDDSCLNVLKLKTQDGRVFEFWAGYGSGDFDMPYWELDEKK